MCIRDSLQVAAKEILEYFFEENFRQLGRSARLKVLLRAARSTPRAAQRRASRTGIKSVKVLVAQAVRLRGLRVRVVGPAIHRVEVPLNGLVLDLALGLGHEPEIAAPAAGAWPLGGVGIDRRAAALIDFCLGDLQGGLG